MRPQRTEQGCRNEKGFQLRSLNDRVPEASNMTISGRDATIPPPRAAAENRWRDPISEDRTGRAPARPLQAAPTDRFWRLALGLSWSVLPAPGRGVQFAKDSGSKEFWNRCVKTGRGERSCHRHRPVKGETPLREAAPANRPIACGGVLKRLGPAVASHDAITTRHRRSNGLTDRHDGQ
jgi:hypothetical protein